MWRSYEELTPWDPRAGGTRPLRIGVLTHIKYPVCQPFAGGLEAFTHDVTLGLRARGHAVTLFAKGGSSPELQAVAVPDEDQCRHASLSSAYVAEHHAYLKLMQGIDDYGFDVIFNNSLHYVPVTMASLIRTPMLTVLHTPPFFEMSNALRGERQRGRFSTLSQANARGWSEVVKRCAVIPNGIDLQRWQPAQAVGEHALWFGRLVPDKGAHLAIDAARLAGIPLRLAGQAVDEAYFKTQIQPRLGPGVEYLGHLQRPALAAELANAAVVLVTPCWEEPFGLVVAEALACGTPVVAFDRGAMGDLIGAEVGCLVPANDVAALAAAIPLARSKSRQACRAWAEAHWSHHLMLERYEALLGEVAAQHA
ncbi:glycosyltransferase family 4 protein [Pseudomonas sp. HR96]|uniref:glycosyltransferase family 4 protein n=1 Tax=Pseudomonas sp. HR96 TaxID=1027966 RepID=UPI002A763E0D|nr:glycosyltransferase family 4 protein [Pseudomonas sp. HR96]WPO98257.1 glycosyltransferase family 4 protein [Pseudomonas sp. HR96]